MDFLTTLNQILILFLLMLSGYIARKLDIIDHTFTKNTSNLVLFVTLPALIIKSMQFDFSRDLLMKSGQILIISLFVYCITIALSYIIPKLLKTTGTQKDIYQFMLIFSNVGFMGYPVIYSIYGEIGVFYTALYNIPFNFLLWTVGIYVVTRNGGNTYGKINFKKIIWNPGIIAVFTGFLLFLFSIKLPDFLYNTLDALGSTTTPISMMIIGATLANVPIREIFYDRKLFCISAARLILMPGMVMMILAVFGLEGLFLGIPVIITAMPAAANTVIFATIYDSDYSLASKGVFITTTLSIITIPLFTLLI